jgi:hypothetical protein
MTETRTTYAVLADVGNRTRDKAKRAAAEGVDVYAVLPGGIEAGGPFAGPSRTTTDATFIVPAPTPDLAELAVIKILDGRCPRMTAPMPDPKDWERQPALSTV